MNQLFALAANILESFTGLVLSHSDDQGYTSDGSTSSVNSADEGVESGVTSTRKPVDSAETVLSKTDLLFVDDMSDEAYASRKNEGVYMPESTKALQTAFDALLESAKAVGPEAAEQDYVSRIQAARLASN